MRTFLTAFFIIVCLTVGNAHEYRDLLQNEVDIKTLTNALILNQDWVSYPDYNDRKGWDNFVGDWKDELIRSGEEALQYEWRVVKASDYLEFERSGSQSIMEEPFGANNNALSKLVIAELAEGKGRFIDQIANGIWFSCEMTSWALSAHIRGEQEEETSLPSFKEHVIDLTAGDMGSFFSWTYYFLKDELDKVHPLVAERLRKNLQERILDAFMERDDFWWQAFSASPETMVNNWNPWCNFNVLTCFLLLEDDPVKLGSAVYRTMVSVDKFINYSNEDGACEEGPSYWGHAAGKMYDYLQILNYATSGKVSLFDHSIIKNMGEYIAQSYVGNGWVVNFADASAKGGGDKGVIFRYGKAVESKSMQQYAAYLNERESQKRMSVGRDMFRSLENFVSIDQLKTTVASVSNEASVWYPETEFCYMRNKTGLFFAAKGGYNSESHNHNDAGTFSLYLNEIPMIIDVGVGTYTRQTFSHERYSIWTMQSQYHNLPMINGVAQSFGREYRASDVVFDPKKSLFSLNLTNAYPENAAIDKWQRSYLLEQNGALVIQDKFKLKQANSANQVNFLTWAKPDVSAPGSVLLEKEGSSIKLTYDARQFTPVVEKVTLSDSRLSRVWGTEIYRLSLNAKQMQMSGKYKFTLMAHKLKP